MGIFDNIGDLAKEHEDKLEQGIEAAGDFVDEKTGGKFSAQVDQVQALANDQLDKLAGKND